MYRRDIHKKNGTLLKWLSCALLINCTIICIARSETLVLPFPERSIESPDGLAIQAELDRETSPPIQQAILKREILSGNVPNRSRTLYPISWDGVCVQAGTLRSCKVELWVAGDYLAVGPDSQSLHVPLTPQTAQFVADEMDCLLPTSEIVNRIYRESDVQLAPHPFSPKVYDISAPSTWILSSASIAKQIDAIAAGPMVLLAGHKKDVVITQRLSGNFNYPRVAIYGWHQLSGRPIQPLSLVHRSNYVDYSHGIRLVSDTMMLDGMTTSVRSILTNPDHSGLLSGEGTLSLSNTRY